MKKCGIRKAFALGGDIDTQITGLLDTGQDQIDALRRSSGLSQRQKADAMTRIGSSMTTMGGTPDYGEPLAGLSARKQAGLFGDIYAQDVYRARHFADGGDIDRAAAARAQADEIMRKYGVSGSSPPAPQPAPAPVAAPAPAPKPQGLMDRLRAVATGNLEKRMQGYAHGGDLINDVAEYWANDNAEFEKTNPGLARRVLRGINPLTGFGSAIGAMHTAAGNGDIPGMAMAGVQAIPAFGVLRAMPAAGALKASVAPSARRTAAAYGGGAVANAVADNAQAKTSAYAHGGEPFVDDAGYIHGPKGVDKVPAQVAETGENILVGDGERIVNQKQNQALKALANQATGMPLDSYLEHATGEPVGPKLKSGLRAAADGAEFDPFERNTARAARAAGSMSPEAAAYTAAQNAPPAAPAAPAAAPKSMIEPLEIGQTSAKQGIKAQLSSGVDAAKEFGQKTIDKIKSVGGSGATQNAAARLNAAANTPYTAKNVVDGVSKAAATVGNIPAVATDLARRGIGALSKVAAPVAAIHDIATDPTGLGIAQGAFDIAQMGPTGFMTAPADIATRVTNNGRGLVQTLGDRFDGSYVPETAAKGTDQLLKAANKYLPDGLLKATGLKVNGDPDATPTLPVSNGQPRKLGSMTDSEYAALTATPTAAELSKWNASAPAAAKPAVQNPEDNANIRSLRSAGVAGDARTIDTANGPVYAGRDGNGRLNVVSGLDRSPAENEALRAKEADRINKDLARQVATFDHLKLESDLTSNNPTDRERAAQRMGLRKIAAEENIAGAKNETERRGQDMALRGHEIDAGARNLQARIAYQKQNEESMRKTLDDLLGGETIEVDGKKQANTERQRFMQRLTKTLGERGRSIAQLDPKYLTDFHTADAMDKDGQNGKFMAAINNWIAGTPDVEDHNPFRRTARMEGDDGKTNPVGFYRNTHGAYRHEGSTVGKPFGGAYDYNRKELFDR